MNSNAYVKSMQDLGKVFNDDFEENWLNAQVDGYKIRLINKPEDGKFYTCGTLMLSPDKPGYAIKYRDGRIYTNRQMTGKDVHFSSNEGLGIVSNFMSGYARVNTADEGDKILVLGNYLLPEKCIRKVSEIYYDCKAFLTLDAEKDFPFDPKHPSRAKQFYVYAYKNVLIHGLTEKYCDLRNEFANAKTIEERAVIYAKAKAIADEYTKYEPEFIKKEKELIGGEQLLTEMFSDRDLDIRNLVERMMDLVRIDDKELVNLKRQVEALMQEKKYITKEKYISLKAAGQNMSQYDILPSRPESEKMFNQLFDQTRSIQQASLIQDATTALAGVVSGRQLSNTRLFKEMLEKEGFKEYNFLKSHAYDCFIRDLYNFLVKLDITPDKSEDRSALLKKMYPLACYSAHELHTTYKEQIIKDFADDALLELRAGYNGDIGDSSDPSNDEEKGI